MPGDTTDIVIHPNNPDSESNGVHLNLPSAERMAQVLSRWLIDITPCMP